MIDKRYESSESEESEQEELTAEERQRYLERERIRKDIAKSRQIESRKSHLEHTKTLLSLISDRDISETVALGLMKPTKQETMYDERLFNRTSGMNSGFSGEDAYNIYDKPLFKQSQSKTFVPKRDKNEMVGGVERQGIEDLVKNRGFSGTEATGDKSGPVRFKKYEQDDVFGVDAFMTAAKRGREQDGEDSTKKSRH